MPVRSSPGTAWYWPAALTAISGLQSACPGQRCRPGWLASSSPAPRRSGPPAGGRWAPAGPPGLDLAGRSARPVLNPFTGPGWLPFGPADLAFRCSLLIVLAYRDSACAEQNTSLP
jgi:hypothetical protein